MAHRFSEYKPFKGAIPSRINGVLISKNQGQSTAYSIEKLQDRGRFFVDPGEEVYMGMIVGEQNKPGVEGGMAGRSRRSAYLVQNARREMGRTRLLCGMY